MVQATENKKIKKQLWDKFQDDISELKQNLQDLLMSGLKK